MYGQAELAHLRRVRTLRVRLYRLGISLREVEADTVTEWGDDQAGPYDPAPLWMVEAAAEHASSMPCDDLDPDYGETAQRFGTFHDELHRLDLLGLVEGEGFGKGRD